MELNKIEFPEHLNNHTLTEQELAALSTPGNQALAKDLNIITRKLDWLIENTVLNRSILVEHDKSLDTWKRVYWLIGGLGGGDSAGVVNPAGNGNGAMSHFQTWLEEQSKARRLLLIDDSANDCVLIQQFTRRYHCEWTLANSAETAEHALKVEESIGGVSLIFLDLNLGTTKAGVDLFAHLKRDWRRVPVVILSGCLTTEHINQITSIGFAIFAQKPKCFTHAYFEELFRIMNIPLRPGYKVADAVDVEI